MANFKNLRYRMLTGAHKAIFRLSRGRLANRAAGMEVVMLTTTGRKSGQPRTTMLTSPVQEGERLILVASYGGDDRDPAWFQNLRDNPEVEVTRRGRTRPFRARVASRDEQSELWPRVVAAFPGYEKYQSRTEREIPLVVLERLS